MVYIYNIYFNIFWSRLFNFGLILCLLNLFFFQFIQLDNIYINTEDSPKKEYIFRFLLHGSISFSVDCANDAHITFTTKPKESEPMVEVLLGGWKNTASAIRYNKQTPDKVFNSFTVITCDLKCF